MAQYIMEVIRFFPPVSGFVYRQRDESVIYLSIHASQCDEDVWLEGGDFVLRDMETYNKLMVVWTDCSKTRVCPAKDLNFVMIYEVLREFIKKKWKHNEKINVTGYSITTVNFYQ